MEENVTTTETDLNGYNYTNKKRNKKNKNKKPVRVEVDMSKTDFPIPYSDARLVEDWYEFNDSHIKPIYPGHLEQMFGGDSSAYMLVYRQRKLNQEANIFQEVPAYLGDPIAK